MQFALEKLILNLGQLTTRIKRTKAMRDFLGQELKIDDFVTYPGSGNNQAEYGLILMRISKMSADALTALRLDTNYGKKIAMHKHVNIKASTRLLKIQPPPKMIEVFLNPNNHFELVSAWLHGRREINWETLAIGKMRD